MTRPAQSASSPAWDDGDLKHNPHTATDKDERVRNMFAAIARSYDLNNRVHSFGRDQAWRRRVVKLCNISPQDHVLDVACGTGDLSMAFAAVGPASVSGLDFTGPMLEIARHKQQARSVSQPTVTYVQGDAMALPFDDSSFDVLSIAFGIRNVSDPAKALGEFHRVLRPGGRLAVLEFSQPTNPLIRSLNNIYTGRIMPLTATLLSRDRSGAYRYLPRSVATFLDREQLAEAVKEAGFHDVSQHPMTFGVCTATLGIR